MTSELAIVLGLLGLTIAMFAANRPRMDVVALIMMTALPLTGVISLPEALSGFSDPNIILIAALFVLGEGLVRTGVAQRVGDLLIRHAGRSEARLIVLLMIAVAGIGSVMSSTGVVAIFIPIVLRVARGADIAPGRLMMPLSVAALISGMMTLVATAPNLVVHGELVRQGSDGFHFFAFTPFGLPVLLLGILYMLFARRWLGPERAPAARTIGRPSFARWIEEYGLVGREHRLAIEPGSPWIGRRLEELDLRATSGINIVAIERQHRFTSSVVQPRPETELAAGDVLFLDLPRAEFDLAGLAARARLKLLTLAGAYFSDLSQAIGMAEVMIPANSALVGRTLVGSAFRSVHGLTVIGMKRAGKPWREGLLDEVLKVGDTLLVTGPWRAIRRLQRNRQDLLPLEMPMEMDEIVAVPSGAPVAIGILALVVALMVSGLVPNVLAALLGCLLLGLFRCIDMNAAYRSIHWQSLILIVGMLPFSLALQNTGGIELAAGLLRDVVGEVAPRLALAAVFVVTALLSLFISNTATAVLMAPVALALAAELGLSPHPFAMTVALAASAAFMTPVSSPVNTLVVGPGGYRFGDFVRVGTPFAIIVLVTVVLLVPLVFPFHSAP
ncbi:MAG: SLC13 family permease [Alphaproteobacteria bacterium]|nr:SLC13 family permease [Alphaproteobacteria bacterium]